MKRLSKIAYTLLLTAALAISGLSQEQVKAQQYGQENYVDYNDVSLQTFYDALAPYGQWVEDAQYGYVWVPNVDQDFRPYYTGGHWVMTDYGNTWVSDYEWGWAPFHYGRWTYDSYYGWLWIPGTEWGPAWVDWREGGGYYGWAPLGPGFTIGVGYYSCPDDWWTFIPPQYLYRHHYYHYWNGPRENTTIINNTTVINNTFENTSNHVRYVSGPRASEVEHITNQPVTTYHIIAASSPKRTSAGNGILNMYRPMQVRQTAANGGRPAPVNAVRAPQSVGRPQSASVNAAPAYHTEMQRNNSSMPVINSHPVSHEPKTINEISHPVQAPQQQQEMSRPPAPSQYQQPQRSEPVQQHIQRQQPQYQQPVQQNTQRVQQMQPPVQRAQPPMQPRMQQMPQSRPMPAPAPHVEQGRR